VEGFERLMWGGRGKPRVTGAKGKITSRTE
jgi:hypothetical protein